MKWVFLALAPAALLAGTQPAGAQESRDQRYQIVAVPGTQTAQAGVYLLNTNTGQSWSLVRETNEWTPLKYWVAPGKQSALPPRADADPAK